MIDLRDTLDRKPVRDREGVLDFLESADTDYCANFGDQWNRFSRIQSDFHSGSDESRTRFFAETGWAPGELKGKVLLDAGCGAGRFSEIALESGAQVVAVDISRAAYACRANLDRFPAEQFLVLRGDLFNLPLKPGSFDGAFSLGVLQHTPDPMRALTSLVPLLKPGARLATWIYENRWPAVRRFMPRTWIRGLTHNWKDSSRLALARVLTFLFFPAGWVLSWIGRVGERLSMFLPYAARHHLRRGSWPAQWQYCVQDTYDWYGPQYELTQTEETVKATLANAGLTNVRRLPARGMAIVGESA